MQMVKASVANSTGDLVAESYGLQDRLTADALASRNNLMQVLLPNATTKAVRQVEAEIVGNHLRNASRIISLINDAQYEMAKATIDAQVLAVKSQTLAAASSRYFEGRADFEKQLTATWRDCLETAQEEMSWANGLQPFFQELAMQKVERSICAVSEMMTQLLQNYESFTPKED
jgi:hypothetical protein